MERNCLKFNKKLVQGPAPGEENASAPGEDGIQSAGKQLCRQEPGGHGGQQDVREPAMCPCGQEGQWCPRVH